MWKKVRQSVILILMLLSQNKLKIIPIYVADKSEFKLPIIKIAKLSGETNDKKNTDIIKLIKLNWFGWAE